MPVVSLPVAIDAIVKASLILAVTSLVAATLRRSSASARHLVWTLGLVSALATPALSIVTPHWQLPIVRVAAAPAVAAAPSESVSVAAQPAALHHAAAAPGQPERGSDAPAFIQKISWTSLLILVWAAGAVLVLGRMLLGLVAVQWISRSTSVIIDAPWIDQARSLAAALGLRGVRFLRTRTQSMPMAWGIFRSSVLIPQDADAWPADRLRIVLLHELAHVKRRDCLTHLVAQAACAAYWFNPLAWMAARRLRTERERACDDLVLASGTRGSDYADQLLEIARVMRGGRFPAVLAGATLAMAHRSQLEGRLMAILDPSISRRGLTRMRTIAAAALFAILIVPVAAVQPWGSEPAALKGPIDPVAPVAQTVTQAQQSDRPIESYPGQAAADNRRNAEKQIAVQDDLQGRVQGAIQGGVTGGIPGGVAGGIQGGVAGGIQGGVAEGIREGVRQGVGVGVGTGVGVGVEDDIATSVVSSVAKGMANGVADAVVRSLPVEHAVTVEAAPGGRGQRSGAADPRAVNALVEALKDTDKDVREAAMHALVQMRDPHIFEPLVTALRD
ncbi:MAG TPA: M56 family metallopeptidase, partial [Vicinamibacterales bacterium]